MTMEVILVNKYSSRLIASEKMGGIQGGENSRLQNLGVKPYYFHGEREI